MILKPHPRYSVYEDWFRREAIRAGRLEAELYRLAGPRYTTEDEILAGVGAFKAGGRWNPPGVMNTVYLSRTPETAMRESNEHHRYYRLPLSEGMPKVVIAVRVVAQSVFDITKAADFPEPMSNLMAEDWQLHDGKRPRHRRWAELHLPLDSKAFSSPPNLTRLAQRPPLPAAIDGKMRPGSDQRRSFGKTRQTYVDSCMQYCMQLRLTRQPGQPIMRLLDRMLR